jgi:hypothetical protein
MVDWMSGGAEAGSPAPIESFQLATPDERLRAWAHSLEQENAKRFSESVELVQPSRNPVWRSVRARQLFLDCFASSAHGPVRRTIEQYWEQTATVVREAGRSREIINYWRAAANDANTEQLFAEARHNATTVLLDQLQTPIKDDLDERLIEAFQAWLEESSTAFEVAQSGWIKLLRHPRGRQVMLRTARSGKQATRKVLHRASGWTAG